jgi:putative ABC transport system permease protein
MPTCVSEAFGAPIDRRDWLWLSVMGRLQPGATLASAAAHLKGLSPGIIEATLPSDRDAASLARYRAFRLTALPAANGASDVRTTYASTLWLVLAITGLVLLLACANLMNLLLARATTRAQEIAVRRAIGASRARVVAQLLTESLVLAAAGTVAGLAIAHPLGRGLVALISSDGNPVHIELWPDSPVLVFAAAVGVLTCIVFGLVPALRASRHDLRTTMNAGARSLTAGRDGLSVQRVLVVVQVAVSLVLVFAAALFVRSFINLITVDTGLNTEGVLLARFADFSERVTGERVLAAHRELAERIRSVRGVEEVAATTKFPLDGSSWTLAFVLPASGGRERYGAKFTYVGPDYFTAVGMRILTGRNLGDGDTARSRPVVVVNEAFAHRYLASTNPIGAQIRTTGEPGYPPTVYEVVGIVSDTKYSGLREPFLPIAFVPIAQHPSPRAWPNMLIRTAGARPETISAIKRAVAQIRPNMFIAFTTLDAQIRDSLVPERLLAWLAGGFGVLASLLAFIGVYGILSYFALRRRREIAIRIALGAGRARIAALCVAGTGVSVAIGLAVGSAVATVAARAARGLLFGLSPADPATLASAVGMVAIVSLIASVVPVVRASRADATDALRCE